MNNSMAAPPVPDSLMDVSFNKNPRSSQKRDRLASIHSDSGTDAEYDPDPKKNRIRINRLDPA